jgi:hypothetical protein
LALYQYSSSHKELDSWKAHMTKSVVPLEPFLFRWCKIVICFAHNVHCVVECVWYITDTVVAYCVGCRKVVSGVHLNDD